MHAWVKEFLRQYPQFEGRNLDMNLTGDILDLDKAKDDKTRVIAVSNCVRNLDDPRYMTSIPTAWTLKE